MVDTPNQAEVTRIPSFGFARGTVVRLKDADRNMIVVRGLDETTACVVVEGDAAGTLRLREYATADLALMFVAPEPDIQQRDEKIAELESLTEEVTAKDIELVCENYSLKQDCAAKDARIGALEAEIARLRESLSRANRFIVGHHERSEEYPQWRTASFYGDWACAQCHPGSDMIKEGFVCALHSALSHPDDSALKEGGTV